MNPVKLPRACRPNPAQLAADSSGTVTRDRSAVRDRWKASSRGAPGRLREGRRAGRAAPPQTGSRARRRACPRRGRPGRARPGRAGWRRPAAGTTAGGRGWTRCRRGGSRPGRSPGRPPTRGWRPGATAGGRRPATGSSRSRTRRTGRPCRCSTAARRPTRWPGRSPRSPAGTGSPGTPATGRRHGSPPAPPRSRAAPTVRDRRAPRPCAVRRSHPGLRVPGDQPVPLGPLPVPEPGALAVGAHAHDHRDGRAGGGAGTFSRLTAQNFSSGCLATRPMALIDR